MKSANKRVTPQSSTRPSEADRVAEEKTRIEAILLSIGEGLFATDKKGKIIVVNRAFEKLIGVNEKDILGKRATEVVPAQDESGNAIPLKNRRLNQVLSGKTTHEVSISTLYYVRKDKTRFPVSVTVTPMLSNGKITGAVEVFRDTSKERELDHAKSEFLNLASHQFRTPLSSIKWVLEVFMEDEHLTDQQKERLNDLHTANQRLIDLTNSLLTVSRMDAGKFVARKRVVDLTKLIHSSCASLKPHADQQGQKIHLSLPAKVPEATVDPVLFSEAFQNLLGNAIDYAPEHSDIEVTVRPIDHQYKITVHNMGVMIPDADREKLFTKFYRGEEAKNIKATGTGLGLYIARAAVEANDGELWFESTVRTGTTFFFTVPAK